MVVANPDTERSIMSKHAIAAGALIALAASPAPALTAQELWADWQSLYAGMGATLSAESESYADGRLQLDGLTTTSTVGSVESRTSLGSVGLVEQADGSVLIDLPASVRMTTETDGPDETVSQNIDIETDGWSGIVREDGVTRVYDLSADSQTYRFSDTSGEVPVQASIALGGMQADYATTEANGTMTFDQAVTAADVTVVADAEGPQAFDMRYALSDVASQASGSLDLTSEATAPTLSEMGLLFTGEITHAGSTTSLSGTAQMGPFELEASSESGRIGFAVGEDSLGYDIASQGGQMALRLPSVPMPVNATLAELATTVTLPKGVSDQPKPLGLSMTLRDLAIDDQIWAMFDPTGQLPREPATVVIDLDGAALMKADIFGDPEAMMALGGPPGELRSLELAELLVSLAGAELTGDGAVTFRNGGPVPQPVGTVTLNLTGGFALMDALVALGFIPAEQAAFVRGMSGMVAETVGEDALRSVIEFTETGGITANGLPLR